MLSIAIYSDQTDDILTLRSKLQDFFLTSKILARVKVFDNIDKFITVPDAFDIYFMDMDCKDDTLSIGQQMMEIDSSSYFIYCSENKALAYDASKIRADYFLCKPIEPDDLNGILNDIKKNIRQENVIIKTPEGDRRVFTSQLNYINIVKRCLCYHLVDGSVFDGQALRGSFEKAIYPLQENPQLIFISPSLLVNILNIKILDRERAVFDNDDILYFPRKAYDIIKDRWSKYLQM